MSFTLSTSAAILYKSGKNHSLISDANSAAIIAKFSDEAEGVLNVLTRYDWVANYSSVGANFKPMLDDAVASYAAKEVIKYDMSGYTNQSEALNMINILEDNFRRAIDFLKEKSVQDVLV